MLWDAWYCIDMLRGMPEILEDVTVSRCQYPLENEHHGPQAHTSITAHSLMTIRDSLDLLT